MSRILSKVNKFKGCDKVRDKLINLRKSKNLTQKELGTLLGVSAKQIGHIETGRKLPSLPVAYKLLKAFNIKEAEIINDYFNINNSNE